MPWILGLLVAVGITTAVVVSRPDDADQVNQPTTNTNQTNQATNAPVELTNSSPTNTAVENKSTAPHSVSIPTLAAMELNGRDLTLGSVQSTTATYTRYGITYKSGDLTIAGIMNIPTGDGPFPVLFLNHGYIDPSVYTNGRGLKREQDYLARQGFAVLHSDYRCHAESSCDGSSEFTLRLGYVKDVLNAVGAVQSSNDPRLSKTEFGMLGHSMGGGVAWNIMVAKPGLIKAYVLFAPVSADLRDNYERWTTRRPAEAEKIATLYGTPTANPAFWDNLSPQTFFSSITEPIMLHHGTADESVQLAWSDRSVGNLKAAGKDIQYLTYPDQPHEFTSSWGTVMQRTTDFFRGNMK